ncbi:ssDNA-binding protein, mitochondrial [Coniosporium apollinis]|uniref:SsDNA-binding protein, mitochondrial n=1 Tax=Coniosporium apollinis TaxID=61459 RepID=A0ABQ9NRD3_9PEZI|nr:ssDNA-binding protein, mitochondrial [Coniosporium apollinis]
MASPSALRCLRRTSAFAPLTSRSFSTTPRASLARMSIIGRLAAEPELTNTSTGREIVRYALGTSYGPKEDRKTSWFSVTCFDEGPRRDHLLSQPKGTLVYVDAEAQMRTFEDESGRKQSRLNLIQRNFEVLSKPARLETSAAEEPDSGIGAS